MYKNVKVCYWRYTFNYNGFVIPYFGIVINKSLKGHNLLPNLLEHEYIHWKQFEQLTLFQFLILYIVYSIKYGYDLNPIEIEARYQETDFVKEHYTFSVRMGLANTPKNPNFRRFKPYNKPNII